MTFEQDKVVNSIDPAISMSPAVKSNANVAADTIANAIANKAGVVNLSNDKVYNVFPIPPELTFTTASDNGAGGATVTQNVFNNATLGAAVTTNGGAGGAGSIVNTYGDGFAGLVYDQLMRSTNNGMGILIKGFTVIAEVGGVQSSTPLNSLNLVLQNADGQGNLIPVPMNVSSAIRNTQQQVGTLTVLKAFYLNGLNQIRFSLPQNTTLTWTFFTQASSFTG